MTAPDECFYYCIYSGGRSRVKKLEQPQVVGRRVRKLLPDFFVEHCFARKYNLYRNKRKEKEKVDKSIVSEQSVI
jgi:hypothetical protein